jgi:ComF family protein
MRSSFKKLLDTFFPPQCLTCGEKISNADNLCPSCWKHITFISKPYCNICCVPFPVSMKEKICPFCQDELPIYNVARSAVKFDEFTARIVHALKYNDHTELAPAIARLIVNAGAEVIKMANYITPVPLHLGKLRQRKYNQAQLLAKFISRFTGIAVVPDLLIRTKDIPSQSGLNRKQRIANVYGAFKVNQDNAHMIKGSNIIIVDDVITTGATLNECARCLLAAGSGQIYGLSFARTY